MQLSSRQNAFFKGLLLKKESIPYIIKGSKLRFLGGVRMASPKLHIAVQALHGTNAHEAGRDLLARLYREETGQELPAIAIADRGKPYFPASKWHFSISHTKRHVFCALSDRPIGIDAEEIDRTIDLRLAGKILSPEERAQYDTAPDKRLALLKLWVLKEAAAKCSGEGLRGYPKHTDFSLSDPRVTERDGCLLAVVTE